MERQSIGFVGTEERSEKSRMIRGVGKGSLDKKVNGRKEK